jgi:gag-polypeptide of LTR copia-type/Zinc knuckle
VNKDWKKDNLKVKSALGRVLSNSLLLECQSYNNFVDMWKFLQACFQKMSHAQRSALKGKFHTMSCGEQDNVKTHLIELENLYQQLTARNILILNEEYANTIIRSLPLSYSAITSTILTLCDTGTIILTPSALKNIILKEYKIRQMWLQKSKWSKTNEITLRASDMSKSEKGKGWNGKEGKKSSSDEQDLSKITCFNCRKKGHKANKCPSLKQLKTEWKKEKIAEATVNTEVNNDSDDVAWATEDFKEIPQPAEELFAPLEQAAPELGIESLITPYLATLATPWNMDTTNFASYEIFDSGATHHMTPDWHRLQNYKAIPDHLISAANQQLFSAIGIREMVVHIPNGEEHTAIRLYDVLYAPHMGITLISVGRIDEAGYSTTFNKGKCVIWNSDGKLIGQIPKLQDLYRIKTSTYNSANISECLTIDELHRRHGHVNHTSLHSMIKTGMITGVSLKANSTPSPCCPCIIAKAKCLPVNKICSKSISKSFGDLIYSDVWGPATTQTIGHAWYFVLFIDDKTWWITAEQMTSKSLVFTKYHHYKAWAKTQFGVTIKSLQSDNGGKYTSTEFKDHCKAQGTTHHFAVHEVHEHNGVPECANYTLLDGVRAVLVASRLPAFFWGEALMYIVWIRNRSPTKALDGKTPYEALYKTQPSISGIHEWGTLCWIAQKHSKLSKRADEGYWMGPDNTSKGQRIYWPDQHSITVEYDVQFVSAPDLLYRGKPRWTWKTALWSRYQSRESRYYPNVCNESR